MTRPLLLTATICPHLFLKTLDMSISCAVCRLQRCELVCTIAIQYPQMRGRLEDLLGLMLAVDIKQTRPDLSEAGLRDDASVDTADTPAAAIDLAR